MSTLSARNARVLIIRLRSIGDVLISTASVNAMRRHYPDIAIDYLVEPHCAGVLTNNPDIDRVIVLPKDFFGQLRVIWVILTTSYYMTINLHGGPRSVLLTMLSLSRKRFGHKTGSPLCRLYTKYLEHPRDVTGIDRKYHMVERNHSRFEQCGFMMGEAKRARQVLVPNEKIQHHIQTLLSTYQLIPKQYAVLHVVKRSATAQWPLAEVNTCIPLIKSKLDLDVVLVGGPDDAGEMDDLAKQWPYCHAICREPLEHTAELIRQAKIFAGIDSGPAHMAAAVNTPVVVLFGPTHSYLWRPWGDNVAVLERRAEDGISALDKDDQTKGLAKISAQAVVNLMEQQIENY